MRSSTDVIAEVVNGRGPELALVLEVSKSRCYEILSTDNPYPKSKRLIRAIAQVNPAGIALIRADMEALFHDLLSNDDRPGCVHEHRHESFEAINAVYDEKPVAVQRKELLEQIASASRLLRDLDNLNGNRAAETRKWARQAIDRKGK